MHIFLCRLVGTCIHESDAELTCMRFFLGVLTYVMLQAFIRLFLRQMFIVHVCVCVCVVCVCVCVWCVCVCGWVVHLYWLNGKAL